MQARELDFSKQNLVLGGCSDMGMLTGIQTVTAVLTKLQMGPKC